MGIRIEQNSGPQGAPDSEGGITGGGNTPPSGLLGEFDSAGIALGDFEAPGHVLPQPNYSPNEISAMNLEGQRLTMMVNEESRRLHQQFGAEFARRAQEAEFQVAAKNEKAAKDEFTGAIKKFAGSIAGGAVTTVFGGAQVHLGNKQATAGQGNRELSGYQHKAEQFRRDGKEHAAIGPELRYRNRELDLGDHASLAALETKAGAQAMAAGGVTNALGQSVGGVGDLMQNEDQMDAKLTAADASRMDAVAKWYQWFKDLQVSAAQKSQETFSTGLANYQQASRSLNEFTKV